MLGNEVKAIELCIKNTSSKTKQLQINKLDFQPQNSSSKLIFSHGAFGLSLLHKKDEN